MSELYLFDDEYKNVRDTYLEKINKIEEDLQTYINDTKSIIQEKDLQGYTADALLDFVVFVEESIIGMLTDIFSRHKEITSLFVDDVESQDDVSF